MIRKWMIFTVSAGLLVSLGVGVKLSQADDEESELGKVMEQVQKHNANILKWTRNPSYFTKYHKDLQKSAKELIKLAKKAKPMKDALSKAKGEKDPQKKWNELMDEFIKTSEEFEKAMAKSGTTTAEAKKAKDSFRPVTKSCSDCHTVFRIEVDEKF